MINTSKDSILKFLYLFFFLLFMTFLIPQLIGLAFTGFEASGVLNQFNFYQVGIAYAVSLIVAFAISFIIKKGDKKYGNSIGFSDVGENPHLSVFKRFSQLQLFLGSIVIFGILGIVSTLSNQKTFTGIAFVKQQFGPVSSSLFSAALIPGSENLGLALVVAFMFLSLRIIARRTNISSTNYKIFAWILIPIIAGIYWLSNHLLRYAGSDVALLTVFGFGFISGLLIMVTGSFIPSWIMHMMNNGFIDIRRFFSSDLTIIIAGVIIIFTGILLYITTKFKKPLITT